MLSELELKIGKCPCRSPITSTTKSPKSLQHHERLNRTMTELNSGDRMVTFREIGFVYVGNHGAKLAERGFVEIDKFANMALNPVETRPSTWLNIGLGIGLPLLVLKTGLIRDPSLQLGLVAAGAHMSTKVEDYVEELMTRAPMRAFRPQRLPAVPRPITQQETAVPPSSVQIY